MTPILIYGMGVTRLNISMYSSVLSDRSTSVFKAELEVWKAVMKRTSPTPKSVLECLDKCDQKLYPDTHYTLIHPCTKSSVIFSWSIWSSNLLSTWVWGKQSYVTFATSQTIWWIRMITLNAHKVQLIDKLLTGVWKHTLLDCQPCFINFPSNDPALGKMRFKIVFEKLVLSQKYQLHISIHCKTH